MFRAWWVTICLICASPFFNAYASKVINPGHVIILSNSNFSKTINGAEAVLVEFYAPWCVHCQAFAPQFEKAAEELKTLNPAVVLAKVDATEEVELSNKYNVKGYPTFRFFYRDAEEEFSGERSKDGVIAWIQQMTGPSVLWADSKELALQHVKNNSALFIAKVSSKNSPGFILFEKFADTHRSTGRFVAYLTQDEPNANETVTVVHLDEGETTEVPLSSSTELGTFCKKEQLPLFGPINSKNFEGYYNSGYDLIWFSGTKEDYLKAAPIIRKVAKVFRDMYRFLWLSTTEFPGHAQSVLGVSKTPALTAQIKDSRYIFPTNEFKNASSIIQFLKDAGSGKIEKFLLSEEIPAENNGPVTVVVGKSFNDIVFQKDKDVLLEIYAPWCGHCKKLEPIYLDFANRMREQVNLVIAKMDGTSNESPNPNITWGGYPSIFFVKAGSEKAIPYTGERTVDALKAFVAEHGSPPVFLNKERDEL